MTQRRRSSSTIVLSHLTRNILISTQETLIFWENGLFNGSALQWRHNERDGVSTHQPHDCLLNRLFRCRSYKTSKLRVTGLCEGNSPLTGEFPTQRASNAENVSIWWRHHVHHLLNMITYIPSQWLAIQTNPNIPKKLKQVTTTAVWFSAGGSDIRKFNPWFATKVPYRSLYVWIVGEWMTTRKSLCYLLFLIISKITNSRYRCKSSALWHDIAYGTAMAKAEDKQDTIREFKPLSHLLEKRETI